MQDTKSGGKAQLLKEVSALEKLWRLRDVAESFDVDYSTLWRWSRDGRLETIKLPGGTLRVKDSELQRILSQEREALLA